jgi:phage protein U
MRLPLMALGYFVFMLGTAPYQQLQRRQKLDWAANKRVGRRDAHQFLGPGEETIRLSGTLVPEISGGRLSLALLREMADTGDAWILLGGDGYYYGLDVIESVDETGSEFLPGGTPRKIEFSVGLKKVDDDRTDLLGRLIGGVAGWLLG